VKTKVDQNQSVQLLHAPTSFFSLSEGYSSTNNIKACFFMSTFIWVDQKSNLFSCVFFFHASFDHIITAAGREIRFPGNAALLNCTG